MEAERLDVLTTRLEDALARQVKQHERIVDDVLERLTLDAEFQEAVAGNEVDRLGRQIRKHVSDMLNTHFNALVKGEIQKQLVSINWFPIIQAALKPMIAQAILGLNISGRSLTQHIVAEVSAAAMPLTRHEGESYRGEATQGE